MNRLIGIFLFSLFALSTGGCDSSKASGAPPFEVLQSGTSNFQHKEIRVIDTQNDLVALYENLGTNVVGAVPTIDFNTELVLFASTGSINGGSDITLESTDLDSGSSFEALVIRLKTRVPKTGCGSDAGSSPKYVIAKVERVSNLININEDTDTKNCP